MATRIILGTLLAWFGFSPAGLASTTISSVDHRAVPVGEKLTFTGSGFTGTSAVTFFWASFVNSANFEIVSDSELKVTFPDASQPTRDHYALVESPSGSTVTLAGEVLEFTGTGSIPSFPPTESVLVKAGAVLQGFSASTRFVYVEAGAVIQNPPAAAPSCVIFAENGATLDLRGTTFSANTPPRFFHSPGTIVLGSLPAGGGFGSPAIPRQINPISLSRGVGPFTLGVPVNVSVVGGGSVSMDPGGPVVPHSTNCTLTATAEPGWLFQGWSGAITSSNPVVTFSSGTSAKNVVATFTSGHVLETYSGSMGTISRDPQQATYAPGQSVKLAAIPAPGYQFVGWGGSLAGSTGNPVSLVMESSQLVTAIFAPGTPPALPRISSVDRRAVPVGDKFTFTGSGFTGTSAVTFFWGAFIDSAPFEVASDSELKVTFPNVSQNIRDRSVLLESPAGSTVTLAGGAVEFTGIGSLPVVPPAEQVLVKAGAVLEGFSPATRLVYVESGAVLRNLPASSPSCVIFAEDGATLDFRGGSSPTSSPPLILYSPGTTILGDLPARTTGFPVPVVSRQIPSLTLSRNIGPFTLGVPLNVSVVGGGSVSMDPSGPFVPHSTNCTLTATPETGWMFAGWSGSITGSEPIITVSSGLSGQNIVATFSRDFTLETYSGSWGSIGRDPQQAAYLPGQPVNLTAIPALGYRFVAWGGTLAGSSGNPLSLTMNGNHLVAAVFEPVTPPALTHIGSVDHPAVPIGGTMTFTGSGFTGTSAVTFFWAPFSDSAAFEVVSDSKLKVTFPNGSQAFRDRFALVESPVGSTVTLAGEVLEFTGTGAIPAFPPAPQILVKAGAVLQGFSPGTRFVYVESGGVLRNVPSMGQGCTIFAEDGATLDLRATTFSTSLPPRIFHSPGTTILGNLPASTGGFGGLHAGSRQIPSLSLSRGIGPFQEGFELDLDVEGPGRVTVDPIQDYYLRGTVIRLTATPDPDNFFVRWTGAVSSTANPATYSINSSSPIKARFSNRPDFFSSWRSRFFTPEQLADPATSGLDADPDNDQITNAGEYAFGTDPTVHGNTGGLRILPGGNPQQNGGLMLEYTRPVRAADIDYLLQARMGGGGWFDGKTGEITFDVTEAGVVPSGQDLETVTLLVKFTNGVPATLFFQLSADITDLP